MKMSERIPIVFMIFALSSLLFGALIGNLAGIQYLDPEFLKEVLPFNRMRELHVSSMISWIILGAIGGVYYYLFVELKHKIFSPKLATFHLVLYIITGLSIYVSILSGNMGGREYLTFIPILMIPILIGWVVFGINYFKSLLTQVKGWPVYMWMWGTGIIFMTYHLSESNFWIFSHFREYFIRDLTVQWKSYGSFTGSWNMLVYGTAIFLMAKIKGDENVARSKIAFFFYFLGLTNLMIGWAHHIYPVPGQPWIRGVAYAISMTEWIVLGSMILSWMRSLGKKEKQNNLLPYRFLLICDIWVFFNVFLALLISIPALNYFTHGTHVIVAHSMGTTIGINTTILLGSALFIVSRVMPATLVRRKKIINVGMVLFNVSLIIFLGSLIIAGLIKGKWMYGEDSNIYSILQEKINPYLTIFVFSGIGLFIGLQMMVIPLLRALIKRLRQGDKSEVSSEISEPEYSEELTSV